MAVVVTDSERLVVVLPRCAEISIRARDAVRGFRDRLGAQRTAHACLLVSELVTNAYVHGQGQIRLTIALHGEVARFAVHDDGGVHAATDSTPRRARRLGLEPR